jgi:outer membrane receptor protein involved in Fe transport
MMRLISLCFLCAFIVCTVNASVFQDGSIHGKVLDPSGFAIPNVNIQIENTGLGAASHPDGSFKIQSIPYGNYTLVATHLRFEPIKMQISISGNDAVDITLQFQRETVILLDGIVVTATRSEKTPEKVPQPVVHISRSEVERRYQYNVGEMLDFVPGVRLIRSGGTVGADYGISIRSLNGGSSSNKTLVLIDGRPINNGWDGGVNFNTLPTEMVERVEVVKGPSSALYGSQATAGVINIMTRDVTPGFHGWLSIGQESNGSEKITDSNANGYGRPDITATNVQFNSSYRNDKSSHLISVGYRQSDQSFITPTENKWDNYDLKYNVKHCFSEKLTCRCHIDIHKNKWKNEAVTAPNLENYDYTATDFYLKVLSKLGIMNGRIYMNDVHSENKSLQSGTKTGNDAYRIGFIGDYTIPLLKNRAFFKFGVDGYLDNVKVNYAQAVEDLTYEGVAVVGVTDKRTGEVTPRS